MSTQTNCRTILLVCLYALSAMMKVYAGEYPLTLTAYLGTTPVLDGVIKEL